MRSSQAVLDFVSAAGESHLIRVGQERDIAPILDYWYQAEPAHLVRMGVLPERMPPRAEFRKLYEGMVASNPQTSDAFFIVVESPTRGLVGYSLFNRFERPRNCHGHAHIFDARDRKRGLAAAVFMPIVCAAFELTGIERIIAEPKETNDGVNRLLRVQGLEPVRSYDKPAVGIVGAMRVNRYELARKSVLALRAAMTRAAG